MPRRPPAPARLPHEALLLALGAGLAAAAGTFWTVIDWQRDGTFAPDGLYRAGVVVAATLALALVVRLAAWVDARARA